MPVEKAVRYKAYKPSGTVILFNVLGGVFVTLFALVCITPFLILISGSLSDEQSIRMNGLSFLSQGFTFNAYRGIFRKPEEILNAYSVSILVTAVGTGAGLILLTMTAYVISRKDFKYRNAISFYFYLTTLFNGGIVCTYIFYIRYYHLKDSLLAIILPGLMPVFYMLIMKNFISGVSSALIESAKMDGAGEFRIFFQIVLPMLGSGLATIGLFMALSYWNDWYNAMLYIETKEKYPLQYLLYQSEKGQSVTQKLAMTCVATGPVILLYPFVQKYFVKGIMIGSVKG